MKRLLIFILFAVVAVPGMAQTIAMPDMVQWHPWKGKRVAYFGDSITDPRNSGSKKKYWGFLEDWLGITPYVYGVSGRQWNDIPRQAQKLQEEHGDSVDAILIFIGTNDYNSGGALRAAADAVELLDDIVDVLTAHQLADAL